jgi:hypothetical protein
VNNENMSSENSNNRPTGSAQNISNENSITIEDAMAVDDDNNSNNFPKNQNNIEINRVENSITNMNNFNSNLSNNNVNSNLNNNSNINHSSTITPNNPSGQKRRINPTMLN